LAKILANLLRYLQGLLMIAERLIVSAERVQSAADVAVRLALAALVT
jgi:hypothetical protein